MFKKIPVNLVFSAYSGGYPIIKNGGCRCIFNAESIFFMMGRPVRYAEEAINTSHYTNYRYFSDFGSRSQMIPQ